MAEINDLNITDASNTARWPENMAPSAVNNAGRADEGLLARWHKDTNASKASTGTPNAYVFAADQTISAYYDGLEIGFDANFANTGSATLNVDGVGAATIKKYNDQDLEDGDIGAGQKVRVIYDGANFQMQSPTRSDSLSVKRYGATGNTIDGTDGVTTAASATFTSAAAAFVDADVGKNISIPGANTTGATITGAANGPADKVWQEDSTGGPSYVDLTTAFNDATTGDVNPFPASEATTDRFIIGHIQQFDQVTITIGTSGVGGTVTWKYWDGSAWAALSGVTDNTTGFTAAPGSYTLTYTVPGDWAKTHINGTKLFYISAEITGVYSTNPILDQGILDGGRIRITATAHGFGASRTIGIQNVTGTTEANGFFQIYVVDADNFDLKDSTFANTYISGGTAHGELDTTINAVGSATSITLNANAGISGTSLNYSYYTDDATALITAITNSNVLEVPPGIYSCRAKVTGSNKDIYIRGFGIRSEIRFVTATDGIDIDQNDDFQTTLEDLLITTTQDEPGVGLSVDYSSMTTLADSREKQFMSLRNVEIRGTNYLRHGWTKGLFMDEVHAPYFQNVRITGRRDQAGFDANEFWPGMTHGLDYRSTQDYSPVNPMFFNVIVRNAITSFNSLGVMEGLQYLSCKALACRDGIVDDRREIVGADTVDPWLTVANCHFNTSQFGIRSVNSSQHFIHDNLLYEFQVDMGYTGISLETGNDPQIHSNHILGDVSATSTSVGIKVDQNNRAFIYGNKIQRCDIPVEVAASAGGIANSRIWNNMAVGVTANLVEVVTYTGGASETSNPAAHYTGVIASGTNAGILTLPNTATNLASINLNDHPENAGFELSISMRMTKGGTDGTTRILIIATVGTLTFLHSDGNSSLQLPVHDANQQWDPTFTVPFSKAAGNATVTIQGVSIGSDSSVQIGDLQYSLKRVL